MILDFSDVVAPYKQINCTGESITLQTTGKLLILPTGSSSSLPANNEYALTEGRVPLSEGTVTFTDDTNTNTGLHHLSSPWIAVYDPADIEVDFFLFTNRPKNLSYTVDSNGLITQLILYPGNDIIYHGKIMHCNLILDSDSDLIPNIFESWLSGSITSFLQTHVFPSIFYITTDNNFIVTSNGKTLEMKL